jgi:hypothetical protein
VQGWTQVDHHTADVALLRSVLLMAWKNVAPKTLVKAEIAVVWPKV